MSTKVGHVFTFSLPGGIRTPSLVSYATDFKEPAVAHPLPW